MRAAAFVLAALLAGCGGSVPQEDIVVACSAPLIPRVLACIPADYRGVDAAPLAPCLSGSAGLVVDLKQCRDEEPAAFAVYLDHRIGHAARVLIESLTD